jgi:hypothetical protein
MAEALHEGLEAVEGDWDVDDEELVSLEIGEDLGIKVTPLLQLARLVCFVNKTGHRMYIRGNRYLEASHMSSLGVDGGAEAAGTGAHAGLNINRDRVEQFTPA